MQHSDVQLTRGAIAYPVLHKAQHRTRLELKKGSLIKAEVCSSCGKKESDLDAHHDDYTQLSSVRWLCASCHSKADDIRRGKKHPWRTLCCVKKSVS